MSNYYSFSDGKEMFKCIELVWGIEDLQNVRHTRFGIYSSGDDHKCYITDAEDVDFSTRLFESVIKTQNVNATVTDQRDPNIWDDWMARLVGLP